MRYLVAIALFLLAFTVFALRTKASDILINEISIDSSPQVVEILNISSSSADLSGWFIDDSGGSTYYTIPTGAVIHPRSCAVFEGDFNLNKSSPDTVRLFNASAPPTAAGSFMVDSFSYKQSPGTGYSYARNPDAGVDWAAMPSSIGSYNQTGQSCLIMPTPTITLVPTVIATPSATATPPLPTATPFPDYRNVYINEVYPYPESGGKEWVELYNDNDFYVNLSDWYIDDMESGGGTPRRLSTSISAHGFGTVEISGSLFNNDGDSVRLLNQDKIQIDGFEYGKSVQGKSLGRTSLLSETVCTEEPSMGYANNPCLDPSPTCLPSRMPTYPTSIVTPVHKITTTQSSVMQSPPSLNNPQHPSVLGEMTTPPSSEQPVTPDQIPIRKLASVSFSYSILTIVSLLIKIKNGLAA